MKIRFLLAALLGIASPCVAGGFSGDGFGSSGFFQLNTIPLPPVSTGLITPVLSIFVPPTSGTAPIFGGLAGVGTISTTNAGTNVRRVPIPVTGTISALSAATTTTEPAAAIVINLNGGTGNTGCTYATASPFNCSYSGTGDHVVAGTLAQWRVIPGGTWTAGGGPAQASFLFQADSGQNGPIFSGAAAAIGSTTTFQGVGVPAQSSSEGIASTLQPAAGQIAGIYVYPNGSDNGANVHTYTLVKNAVSTALLCAGDATNPTLGCCANVGGTGNIGGSILAPCSSITAISVAVGDTLSVQVSCGGTCAAVIPGMALIWQPTTAGQVPLYTTTPNTPSNTVPWFSSAVDSNFTQTAATNWNITPNLSSTMTLSNLLACATATITTGTWTEQFQYSTSLIAPGTSAPLVATYGTGAGFLCPGTIMHQGTQDVTHTQAINAGYTLGFTIVPASTPTGAGRWKTSMVATVP